MRQHWFWHIDIMPTDNDCIYFIIQFPFRCLYTIACVILRKNNFVGEITACVLFIIADNVTITPDGNNTIL